MMVGVGSRTGGEEMRTAFLPSSLSIAYVSVEYQQDLGVYLLIGCGGRGVRRTKTEL